MTKSEVGLSSVDGSTEITRFNAMKHGLLSRYTVLPWEDGDEYQDLVASLSAEHMPDGPTEEHLVEELAGILWRKRRLRLAEAATYSHGLHDALKSYRDTAEAAVAHVRAKVESGDAANAVRSTAEQTQAEILDMQEDEAMTRRALDHLGSRRNDAYEVALSELRQDTQDWWKETIEPDPEELEAGQQPASADAESLRRFLESQVLPWFDKKRAELENRPLIRQQALGEALDPHKLERLGRYEVHLDRKLERMLSMLLKLKQLRSDDTEA